MDEKVWAAVVTAAASIAVALYSAVTARTALLAAKNAEERAKRFEQIRLHATAAGESLLESLGDLLILAQGIQWRLKNVGPIPAAEALEAFRPIPPLISKLKKTIYSTAIYTTLRIRTSVEVTIAQLTAKHVDLSKWDELVKSLHDQINETADHFHETYLKID